MNHINLDAQGEAVRQFFLSLPADPEGAVVEANGRAVARLVPIPAAVADGSNGESAWTWEKNARRCFLIDREIDGSLNPEEARELAVLQGQMLRHVERVAPLPLEATRRLYDELLAKAGAARNG
jgi:antitoxin (DNA-binding transcriptional repressor) of toxin-antitoxin stability system